MLKRKQKSVRCENDVSIEYFDPETCDVMDVVLYCLVSMSELTSPEVRMSNSGCGLGCV